METRVELGYELPPLIFDQPPSRSTGRLLSDDSVNAEGSEDAQSEFKPYLEAQTDSIVYTIQSVLSGVCTPTPPSLNEKPHSNHYHRFQRHCCL